MIRSLNTGVLGMQQFQTNLDAIGNNLANINTVAYKSARVDFADTLNQTLRAPTPDSGAVSGKSGMQVGNGLTITAIKNSFTQGAVKQTGVRTDLAVAGEGFFMVKDPTTSELYATRAGDFRLDKNSFLVTNNGQRVQGLNKQAPAFTDAEKKEIGDIQLDVGKYMLDRTGVTIDSSSEKLTKTAHGFSTGMQLRFSGTIPVSDPQITASTVLYARVDGEDPLNKLSLHATASDAAAGTNAINYTGTAGTPPTSVSGIKVNPFTESTPLISELITKTNHGLTNGMEVKFKTTAPGGADTASTYYAKKISADTFTLHQGTSLTDDNRVNFTTTTYAGFTTTSGSSDLTTTSAHGFNTGDAVRFNTSAPGGANITTTYYVKKKNDTTISLHNTTADALDGNLAITLSTSATFDLDARQGTFTVEGQNHTNHTLVGGASISSFNIGGDGRANMLLSDGTQYNRGQVLMQVFQNTQALMKEGANLYSNLATAGALGTTGDSASSTEILAGAAAPGSAGLGRIESGALELSNVDMAREFATMITTQRAFQANARVVSTSDEILQEMMQLKR